VYGFFLYHRQVLVSRQQCKMSNSSYWGTDTGKAFLADPEGFEEALRRARMNEKEAKLQKYIDESEKPLSGTSLLESEWESTLRTKLSVNTREIFEKLFQAQFTPPENRVPRDKALHLLRSVFDSNIKVGGGSSRLSHLADHARKLVNIIDTPSFDGAVPVGLPGEAIVDMDEGELQLWLGAADNRINTSLFITNQDAELERAEEMDILNEDIDWSIPDRGSSKGAGGHLLQDSSSTSFAASQNVDASASQVLKNKYGQTSRYAAAKPAGLPGHTYHLHGLPCRLYDILGEPRETPVRVNSVVKYDLDKVTNDRFVHIEGPVRRVTNNASASALRQSRSETSLLSSTGSSILMGSKTYTAAPCSSVDREMSTYGMSATSSMKQLGSTVFGEPSQFEAISIRPGIVLEVKPGVVNFGRLCLGKMYQATFNILNISVQSTRVVLIPPRSNELRCHFTVAGQMAPGIARTVIVVFTAKRQGKFSETIRIKSPDEILEMPVRATVELPTKHDAVNNGPSKNVTMLTMPLIVSKEDGGAKEQSLEEVGR